MMQQHCKYCQTWSCFQMEGNRTRSIISECCNKALGWDQTPLNCTSYLCPEGIGTFINWSGPSRTERRRQVVKRDPRKMGAGYSWGPRLMMELLNLKEQVCTRKNSTRKKSLGNFSELKQRWEAVDVIMTGGKSDWQLAMRGDKQSNWVKVKQAFLISWPN